MTNCPPKLRGDLSKWLCEINTGVYVGHVSSRVRDALWERVCSNLQSGSATMVFSSGGEQKMDFRVHNTAWTPVDLDGIKLMRRPLAQQAVLESNLKPGFSNAAKHQISQKRSASATQRKSYAIIDLETTGLNSASDEIIELGAIMVRDGIPRQEFSRLICCQKPVPKTVEQLTGLSNEKLQQEGVPLSEALTDFFQFIGSERLVGYHIAFDTEFIRVACQKCGYPLPTNTCMDLLPVARRKLYNVPNFQLATVAEHLGLEIRQKHRAVDDCKLVYEVYCKLNEI